MIIIHILFLNFKQMAEEMCLQSETISKRPDNCKGALAFLDTDIVV